MGLHFQCLLTLLLLLPLLLGHLEAFLLGDSLVAMNVEWWLTLFLGSLETLLSEPLFVLVLTVVRSS